jgi:type IV pilus assembly protein PilN
MIKINLLSEGKRPAAVRKARVPGALKLEGKDLGPWMILVGVLIGIAGVFVAWKIADNRLMEKGNEVAAAQREVDALASVIKEVDDYKAKKGELERKIGIINDLKANQQGPVRLMDSVSRALPELLWLDKMTMTATSIEIEGRAFNTNAVANFIENLDKVPEIDEPTLKITEQQTGGTYKFNINFTFAFAKHGKEAGAEDAPGTTPATAGTAGTTTSATSG